VSCGDGAVRRRGTARWLALFCGMSGAVALGCGGSGHTSAAQSDDCAPQGHYEVGKEGGACLVAKG
jgi:hypothetical protein